jgi:hypothetical protein
MFSGRKFSINRHTGVPKPVIPRRMSAGGHEQNVNGQSLFDSSSIPSSCDEIEVLCRGTSQLHHLNRQVLLQPLHQALPLIATPSPTSTYTSNECEAINSKLRDIYRGSIHPLFLPKSRS